jgi:hypothetical protein
MEEPESDGIGITRTVLGSRIDKKRNCRNMVRFRKANQVYYRTTVQYERHSRKWLCALLPSRQLAQRQAWGAVFDHGRPSIRRVDLGPMDVHGIHHRVPR